MAVQQGVLSQPKAGSALGSHVAGCRHEQQLQLQHLHQPHNLTPVCFHLLPPPVDACTAALLAGPSCRASLCCRISRQQTAPAAACQRRPRQRPELRTEHCSGGAEQPCSGGRQALRHIHCLQQQARQSIVRRWSHSEPLTLVLSVLPVSRVTSSEQIRWYCWMGLCCPFNVLGMALCSAVFRLLQVE
jgi:hypothetical protein